MAGIWQSVHGAVNLGDFQGPPPAITEAPSALVEPARDAMEPVHGGAVRAGRIPAQCAIPNISGHPFRPISVLDAAPKTLRENAALSPPCRFEIPVSEARFETAAIHRGWDVVPAPYDPAAPELQRSLEPRRIWNRVALRPSDCVLRNSGVQAMGAAIEPDRREPPNASPTVPGDREPVTAQPLRLANQGLPAEPEGRLRQQQFPPASAIRQARQIGPKLRVPLPAVPRLH